MLPDPTLRLALAALHLVALGLGLGAVLDRAAALREPIDGRTLRRVFRADTLWGLAALLWIGTGVWRVLASTEKGVSYYMHNHLFFAKMGFLVLVLLLELWPMMTLIRWRRGATATPAAARRIVLVSRVEALLVVAMIVAAVMMARGYGLLPGASSDGSTR